MPLYDKNLSIYVFLENPKKPPGGTLKAARRRMNINPILGFLWWTAWQQGWLRQVLRLWQVYQVAQVVTGKTGISFPKRLVYTN